ncbi:MAG: two-component system sensor histidine kinase AtoS [Rhodocyclaceae bacterium]
MKSSPAWGLRIFQRLDAMAPQTLRMRMLVLTAIVVCVSILALGFMADRMGRTALLEEKQRKLFGIARLLNAELGDGFDAILNARGASSHGRDQQIRTLNAVLGTATDRIASAYAGTGAGYYNRSLDAIVTYGPSAAYADRVGLSIAPDHPGRKVMDTGRAAVESGRQVRGNIMNAMLPIVRDGRVEGYIWANELTDDVQREMRVLDGGILLIMLAALAACGTFITFFSNRVARQVDCIKEGVRRLRYDWHQRIPPLRGEFGEISAEINAMAVSLHDALTFSDNILDSTADAIITVNTHGVVMTINPAALRMTGFTRADTVGRAYADMFRATSSFRSPLLDTLHTGRGHLMVETDYPAPRGMLRVRCSTNPLKDGDGTVLGAVVVFQDITYEYEMAKRVAHAERLATLGELMAGVAHEMRNPLTAIRGFGQYLQRADDPDEWREYLPIILKEVDAINRVIQELLTFARSPKACFQRVLLADLARDALRLAQAGKEGLRIDFRLRVDDTVSHIMVDAEQIKQALLNVLLNAVQAISGCGRIDIFVTRRGQSAAVMVRDDGCGIAPENLDRIFDPFFTTKADGTGLGMAMVQRVAMTHHGSVEVSSTLGEGCTVTLILPIDPPRSRSDFDD